MSAAGFRGREARFVLPVTMSHVARRQALLRTGIEPDVEQAYIVDDFMELEHEDRARLVAIHEAINTTVDWGDDHHSPWHENVAGAKNDAYLSLTRDPDGRWRRRLPEESDSHLVDEVFYATPGRTITAIEKLEVDSDGTAGDALQAMLLGAPLVADLGNDGTLELKHVLAAYEQALKLADELIKIVDSGARFDDVFFFDYYIVTDDALYFCPDLARESPNRPAALLREANPEAYEEAKALLQQLESVPGATVREKVDGICGSWWSGYGAASDERRVTLIVKPAVTKALKEAAAEQNTHEAADRYEKCRATWIDKHGSQRLKRAANRGYRHDGIYRDERLAAELPEFVGSLGRKPTVRELVNPSAEALELEAQVLARAEALGITEDQVRLVYAEPGTDSDWAPGEFVQIEGYLARHTVWRSVSGMKDDDIPF
jgi:hypothetical protein